MAILLSFILVNTTFAQSDKKSLNRRTVYRYLTSEDKGKNEKALAFIADNTLAIEPTTLMIAGMMLYQKGFQDSAMYWVYLGDMRSRYLASLFLQSSDAALYSSMHQIVIEMTEKYIVDNGKKFPGILSQVLKADSLNPFDPVTEFESLKDSSRYIPRGEWQSNYDLIRQQYRRLEQEALKKEGTLFEDKKQRP